MEFADTGHKQEEHRDLSVSLLMVLHALRLEWKKLMELTPSSHRSCFYSSWESKEKAALSEEVPTGARMMEQ